ncbi:hypothetical protein F5Y15DRAFT_428387 [Xylariaceae sp. FL0016]|nr:hypothetical protein F5Y15DRAFT_428387 [Xylariaceae sp. FL0016]
MGTFSCNKCEYGAKLESTLSRHVQQCHEAARFSARYQCPHCSYGVREKPYFLRRHIQICHPNEVQSDEPGRATAISDAAVVPPVTNNNQGVGDIVGYASTSGSHSLETPGSAKPQQVSANSKSGDTRGAASPSTSAEPTGGAKNQIATRFENIVIEDPGAANGDLQGQSQGLSANQSSFERVDDRKRKKWNAINDQSHVDPVLSAGSHHGKMPKEFPEQKGAANKQIRDQSQNVVEGRETNTQSSHEDPSAEASIGVSRPQQPENKGTKDDIPGASTALHGLTFHTQSEVEKATNEKPAPLNSAKNTSEIPAGDNHTATSRALEAHHSKLNKYDFFLLGVAHGKAWSRPYLKRRLSELTEDRANEIVAEYSKCIQGLEAKKSSPELESLRQKEQERSKWQKMLASIDFPGDAMHKVLDEAQQSTTPSNSKMDEHDNVADDNVKSDEIASSNAMPLDDKRSKPDKLSADTAKDLEIEQAKTRSSEDTQLDQGKDEAARNQSSRSGQGKAQPVEKDGPLSQSIEWGSLAAKPSLEAIVKDKDEDENENERPAKRQKLVS